MIDEKFIGNFASVKRFSGSFLFQPETVPDHSIEMALICINFSSLVKESDVKDLCYRCVIHDFEESITSDIPRPIKYWNPEIKKEVDKAAFEMLADSCGPEFAEEVRTAKDKSNVNGFLVHLADRIQCFCKMSREVEVYGNKSLKSDLELFKSSIHELFIEIKSSDLLSTESKEKLTTYIKSIIINY